jgi:hypothetical protein
VAWGVNTTFYGNTSTSSSTKDNPHISCNGNNITVAYVDRTAADVIIGNSTDNGATWTWSNPVTSCANNYALVERRGQRIYVIFTTAQTDACYNGDVIFFNSTNGGSTWGPTTTIFNADAGCGVDVNDYTCYARNSMAVNGTGSASDTIHVAVQKGVKVGGTPTVYISYRNSTNSGTGWNTASDLTSSGNTIDYPSVNFYGSNVYISYWDSTATANDIYFLNNSNYGSGSFTNTRIDKIGTGTARAKYSSTAINNNTQPCVFWQQDNTTANRENIVYRARNNTNWDDTVYNITTDFLQHQYINTRANYNASGIDIVWVNGTTTPYNITYNFVNCSYTNIQAVADSTPPKWSANLSSTPSQYSPTNSSQFNVTWGDETGFSTSLIWFNSTVCTSNCSMTNNSGVWSYSVVLPAGNYRWAVYGNDTTNNQNKTDEWNFTINVNTSTVNVMNLTINGTESNKTYIYLTTSNATGWYDANVFNGQSGLTFTLYRNTTTIGATNPISDVQQLNGGDYNYTYYTAGNTNYSSAIKQFNLTILGYLEVQLVTPPSALTVDQNSTFVVNASVYCRGGNCGTVNGTVRYNGTTYPDTPINVTDYDKPFFVNESSPVASKACSTNPLNDADEFCNISWVINATGDYTNAWKVGVKFNSTTTGSVDNHTDNSTITIIPCTETIVLLWNKTLNFTNVNPNTINNSAPDNNNNLYNITNNGTCSLKIWIKGTNLQSATYNSVIPVGNLSWNTTEVTQTRLNTTYTLLDSLLNPVTNITTYYWLDVPPTYAANYNGNITICSNDTQGRTGTVC